MDVERNSIELIKSHAVQDVVVGKKLGEGHFSAVFRGIWQV